MKIAFLSFSKCAGVAIRSAVMRNNPQLRMAGAWSRSQLSRYTIPELNRFDFFAGHFDWSDLDCFEGDRFVFTVLRPPLARTLSQYCHWRDHLARGIANGVSFSTDQQDTRRLLCTNSAAEFFQLLTRRQHGELRDCFDNLYTYYFFYRGHHGRDIARRRKIPMTRVFDMALTNMACVDYVATFANLERDMKEVEKLCGLRFAHDLTVEHPTTFSAGTERSLLADRMDPSGQLTRQLQDFVAFDTMLYELAVAHPPGRTQRLQALA